MRNQRKISQVLVGFLIFTVLINVAFATNLKKIKQPSTETIASKEFSYQISPIPSFVDRLTGSPTQGAVFNDQGDSFYFFYDRQISLLGDVPEQYVHYEGKPLAASALPSLSQVQISFNPAYQKLTVHGIHVWRDGKSIDLTHTVKLDLLQREDNLDKSMYDGNVTAVGILPDIRVNDAIEIEYTVSGANPIFGKRFADIFSITREIPLSHYRLRISTPENRPLNVRAPQGLLVKESNANGISQYLVESDNVKPYKAEDKTPEWYQPYQLVHVSEYKDWSEVGTWANGLFSVNEPLSSEIQKQIQTWKDAHLSKDQLTVEALRWVQSQVRYFGVELGVNSHLPSPPNKTFERKYGDCKDKSLLLTTLLKSLDIDAEPALASLTFRRNVANLIPSPAVFDHVIVRTIVDGKTYWLDPTLSPQFGKLDSLGVLDYGSALVLGENAKQLTASTYPENYNNHYLITNHFKLSDYKQPVQLTSEIKIDFNGAELFRVLHEKQSKDEFNKNFQGDVLRIYPKAKFLGDVDFQDDKINNKVTITSKYSIEDFMKYEPGFFRSVLVATDLIGLATIPKVSQRISPFALPAHQQVIETDEFDFPEVSSIKPNKAESTKRGEFWTLISNSNIQNQKMTQVWTLSANKDAVPASKISEYSTETKEIREQLVISIKLAVGVVSNSDKINMMNSYQRLERKYGNSSSDRVKAEMRGSINLVLLSNDIDSNKLSDKQLAEAYAARSQIYDDQGNVSKALEDIRAARKLDPDNIDYMGSEADTLLGNGEFEAANTLYEQVIQLGKAKGTNVSGALRAYGESLHYSGKNKTAKEKLDEAVQQANGEDALYIAIWRYIAAGQDSDNAAALQATLSNIQDQAWPYDVAQMLLGKITPDQLLSAAVSKDKGIQEDQYCEAFFYIGQKYLLDNNKAKAKEYFQKSIDQGVMPYIENNFSLYELGKSKSPKKDGLLSIF